jgi:hypothetical protein
MRWQNTSAHISLLIRFSAEDKRTSPYGVSRDPPLLTRRKRPKPRGKKSPANLTTNVVMEHSRTTVAMAVPTPPALPANTEVRKLPDGTAARI